MKPFSELTMRGRVRRLRQLALHALAEYELDVQHLRIIDTGFNSVFRVDTAGGRRLALRINLPNHNTQAEIRSEMMWLDALAHDTDLRIPAPLRNRAGDLVTGAGAPGVPEGRDVVIFSWMAGRSLRKGLRPKHLEWVGEFMARLHDHAQTFQPSEGFVRKRMDDPWMGPDPTALFPVEQRGLLQEVAARVQGELDAAQADGYHIIHSDLHLGNIRFPAGGGISAFDFDDMVWGHFAHDIGISLYYLQFYRDHPDFPELRAGLQRGYKRVRDWPEIHAGQVEAFRHARALELISFLMTTDNPDHIAWRPPFIERQLKMLRGWMTAG